jgi:hypothetical protein
VTGEGERHPTEKAAALITDILRNFRRKRGKYGDDLDPAGAAYLLSGLMVGADSRRAASGRAWTLLFAPLEGGGVCATTNAETLGVAFVRLLTDEALFRQAREVWVAGDQGLATIEFRRRSHIEVQGHWPRFCARQSHRPRALA